VCEGVGGEGVGMKLGQAKHFAHLWFDPIWKEGHMTRTEAYRWLSEQTGVPSKECHISKFDIGMCEAVIWLCRNKLLLLRAKAWHYSEANQ
jgi:hypothetical protein